MGICERLRRVEAPADEVWGWMSQTHNLFSVNLFHAEVHSDEPELRQGAVVTIDHDFFGVYQQRRQAKIRELRPYFVAFGEYKDPEEPGRDPFPHSQSFQVVPVDDDSCIIVNHISGRYVFPGSGVLGERLFRRYMPYILDDDNQVIAVGCGALEPAKLHIPKGLLLWPAMVAGARLVKKSTRRQVLERMKAEHTAAAEAGDPPAAATGASAGATDPPAAATGASAGGA